MNVLNEWWNLESSQNQVNDDKTNKEYERVFRWIRWEAEKIYFDFKKDYQNNLIYNGNHYMEIFTKNLLEYIEFHHYMIVPLYKSLDRMDIMRAIMDDDPQGDYHDRHSLTKIKVKEIISSTLKIIIISYKLRRKKYGNNYWSNL
ncbi:hypothetical protein DA469_22150 [Bacillus subtilis]|nr:hypothetical protein DA469_22150 [Bacillus subtilis]